MTTRIIAAVASSRQPRPESRGVSFREVALARFEQSMKQVRKGAMPEELERERLASTTRLWELAIIGLVTALCIASTALPLYVVYLMVKALAEKSTHILAAISYTSAGLVGASSGSAVLVGGLAKYRSQRKELIRLRERCAQLEGRLKRKGRK